MASIRFNVTEPNVTNILPTHTSAYWYGKFVSNNYTEDTNFSLLKMNDNNDLPQECLLMSQSLETEELTGEYNRSYNLKGVLHSDNTWTSPVIDLRKMHSIIIGNIINFDSTDEDKPRIGRALAKYLSKPIGLSMTSEDMDVYLTAYKPDVSDIEVYIKVCHAEDVKPFDDHNWIKLATNTRNFYSSSTDKNDFIDLFFTMPDEVKTGENGEVEYTNDEGFVFTGFSTFAIKIVLLSLDSSKIPRIKNLRGIALQI